MYNYIRYFDEKILYYIQKKLRCKALNFIFPKISAIGNGGFIWIAVAVILMLNKAYRKTGLIVVFGLMAGVIFGNLLLKPLTARPRPCWNDKSIELLIPVPHDYSFPSGHTISSVTASILLSVSSKFGYISIPVAILISFSRLYLYVHYPSDIIAGVITGILISLCILYFI